MVGVLLLFPSFFLTPHAHMGATGSTGWGSCVFFLSSFFIVVFLSPFGSVVFGVVLPLTYIPSLFHTCPPDFTDSLPTWQPGDTICGGLMLFVVVLVLLLRPHDLSVQLGALNLCIRLCAFVHSVFFRGFGLLGVMAFFLLDGEFRGG